MNTSRLHELFEELKSLEEELVEEIQHREEELSYEIKQRTIQFKEEVVDLHRKQVVLLRDYLRNAHIGSLLSAPIIWSLVFPALLMDLFVTVFQYTCFPLYNIPRVRRSQYVVLDRRHLKYLNIIEKINCTYCGYFNGVIAYVQEVAARTEQYWCPIKHATRIPTVHSRYSFFSDFGDATDLRKRFREIRRSFSDIQETKKK